MELPIKIGIDLLRCEHYLREYDDDYKVIISLQTVRQQLLNGAFFDEFS